MRLGQCARHLRVPVAWLRREAQAGRIPHLLVGKATMLFDADAVEQLLLQRARGQEVPNVAS